MRREESELTVITRAKELCMYVLTVTDKSPKKFRFTLVSRLQNYSLDIVQHLYMANSVVLKYGMSEKDILRRKEYQNMAMTVLRMLAYMAMIARECGCILPKQQSVMADSIMETQRLLYAWGQSDAGRSREYLKECLDRMREYAENILRLEFNEKTQMHHISQGVDYLGFHFYLADTGKVVRKLRQSGKKRIKRKLSGMKRLYGKDEIDIYGIGRCLNSYRAHLSHGHTYRLRKNIWNNFILTKTNMEGERQ